MFHAVISGSRAEILQEDQIKIWTLELGRIDTVLPHDIAYPITLKAAIGFTSSFTDFSEDYGTRLLRHFISSAVHPLSLDVRKQRKIEYLSIGNRDQLRALTFYESFMKARFGGTDPRVDFEWRQGATDSKILLSIIDPLLSDLFISTR